jgi:hypothetical protein
LLVIFAISGRPQQAETRREDGTRFTENGGGSTDVPPACAEAVRGQVFATGTLEARLTALRSWSSRNSGRVASLVVTDQVLTEEARRGAAVSGAPFRDAAVSISADGIRVSATAHAAFFQFPVSAVLIPEASDGRLRMSVRDLQTGGLPAFLRPEIEKLVGQAADPTAWRLPMRVEAMELRSGCAVVRGAASG